jgi:hypothetical protein
MLENCINKTVQNITDLLPSFALPIVLLFTPAPDFLKKAAWIAPVAQGAANILKDQKLVDNMNLQNAMCGLTILAITGTTLNSSIQDKYKCFCVLSSGLITLATYKPQLLESAGFALTSIVGGIAGVAIAISDDLSNHQFR